MTSIAQLHRNMGCPCRIPLPALQRIQSSDGLERALMVESNVHFTPEWFGRVKHKRHICELVTETGHQSVKHAIQRDGIILSCSVMIGSREQNNFGLFFWSFQYME